MMERRLRILFILDQFPGPVAGTEGQFWLLFQNLDRQRFEPGILLLRKSEYLERAGLDVPLVTLDVQRLASPRSVWRLLKGAWWARRNRYDIAHIFFNDSAMVFPPLLGVGGMRVIVSRRDLGFWHTPGQLSVLRLVRRFVDAVIANCRAAGDVACQAEGYDSRRVHVIHNGLRRSVGAAAAGLRAQLELNADTRLIVIVANLRPLKRIDDAVRALSHVVRQVANVALVVAGEDRPGRQSASHRAEIEQLAGDLGIAGRVKFLGGIADPMPVIAASDIGVLVSETEGLSNTLIEYMLASLPIVCTDVGGNSELVTDREQGFIVPVGDTEAMAAALLKLLRDPELARRLGASGKRRAVQEFSSESMVASHEVLYRELVHGTEGADVRA